MQPFESCDSFAAIHYRLKVNTHSSVEPARLGPLPGNLADIPLSNLITKNNYGEIGKPVILDAVFSSNMWHRTDTLQVDQSTLTRP